MDESTDQSRQVTLPRCPLMGSNSHSHSGQCSGWLTMLAQGAGSRAQAVRLSSRVLGESQAN